MNRLLSANFIRLWKDKVFWVCMIFMFGLSVYLSFSMGEEQILDNLAFIFVIFIGIVQAAFCSLFIGTEYSDGTMRNKMIIGHKRASIYAANCIVCFAAGLMFVIIYLIPALIIGTIRLGWFTVEFKYVLLMLAITAFMIMAVTSFITMLAMLLSNKATCAVICVLCGVVILFVGVYIKSRLGEPQYYDGYVYSDSTGTTVQERCENTNYLSGVKRDVYQFMLDFLPSGQAFEIVYWNVATPVRLLLYSLIIVVLSTGVGYGIFRRKDVK